MHPASHVAAASAEAGAILEAILATVVSAGAWIHPDARLSEAEGAMSVNCDAGSESVLLHLPRELLIPIDSATWADSARELRLVDAPRGLTPITRDLLDLHVALYNATNKIPWISSHHPRAALGNQSQIVAAIRRVRPRFGEPAASTAESFLSTRKYGLKPVAGELPSDGQGRRPVLLPLVDLLNHDPCGARLSVGPEVMTVLAAMPRGTAECFVTYGGRRDVLDLALQYAFLDRETQIASSAPIQVVLPNLGSISIGGSQIHASHPLDAPAVEVVGDELSLSHLTFDSRHPERYRAVLRLAVQGVAMRRGMPRASAVSEAEAAVAAVVDANLGLLDGLAQVARRGSGPAAGLVADAASRQAAVVRAAAGD